MPLYLGFDSSTQSLTATVIEVSPTDRRVVFHHSIVFDRDLPHYRTTNGVRRHEDALVVTSPPLMWVEALDELMALLSRHSGIDRGAIAAIGGCAQQHGSVYLNASAAPAIARLDPSKTLVEQLAGIFSRAVSCRSTTFAPFLALALRLLRGMAAAPPSRDADAVRIYGFIRHLGSDTLPVLRPAVRYAPVRSGQLATDRRQHAVPRQQGGLVCQGLVGSRHTRASRSLDHTARSRRTGNAAAGELGRGAVGYRGACPCCRRASGV